LKVAELKLGVPALNDDVIELVENAEVALLFILMNDDDFAEELTFLNRDEPALLVNEFNIFF